MIYKYATQVVLCLLANVYISSCGPYSCDPSKDIVHEGNNGESSALSWLGVLRVNLFEGTTFRIALTGIVLVKEGYAIAVADDIAKMPKRTLMERSKAMFIPTPNTPWYCTVKDYMTHPEYQFTTMSTVALLELEAEDIGFYPMKPICWPSLTSNITTDLYGFGFIDENKLLEKNVYKLQHVGLELCKEFYDRAGFTEGMMEPNSYLCAFAAGNRQDCVWDNGMVLASNTSGYWKLLGFGIRGPGCSAPSRFLNMLTYFNWIDTSTDKYDIDYEYRRSAWNIGLKNNEAAPIRDIPIHDLFTMNASVSRRVWCPQEKKYSTHDCYNFDTEQYQYRYYTIEKIDRKNVVIWAENVEVPTRYGNCSGGKERLFVEETSLRLVGYSGTAIYKVSVMDLNAIDFSCIDIRLTPITGATATIYYGATIDNMEAMSMTDIGEDPEEIMKHYIERPTTTTIPDANDTTKKSNDAWNPGPHLKMKYIKDKYYVIKEPNINVFLKFVYSEETTFSVSIYTSRFKPKVPNTTETSLRRKNLGKVHKNVSITKTVPSVDTHNNTKDDKKKILPNNDLKKTMGVEIKEVDRYMKEIDTESAGVRVVNSYIVIVTLVALYLFNYHIII